MNSKLTSVIFLLLSLFFNSSIFGQEKQVKIGNHIWRTVNFSPMLYNNGDSIPHVQDAIEFSKLTTGAWRYYEPEFREILKEKIKLYNWYAINDQRGLTRKGWHIASKKDWTDLISFFGDEKTAGQKIIKDTSYFNPKFTGSGSHQNAYLWTSTEKDNLNAFYCSISKFGLMMVDSGDKTRAYGIRLVKD